MLEKNKHPFLLKKTMRRWLSNKEGVTVIEFAMIAPIFFGLLFMIIESGIVFTAGQLLETSVTTASRSVLVGTTQNGLTAGNNEQAGVNFKQAICEGMSGLINIDDCKSGIKVDMNKFSATATASDIQAKLALPVKADGTLDASKMTCANFGGADDYMLIRAYYQYPIYADFGSIYGNSGFSLSAIGGSTKGHSLITGTVAMKLEPFSGTGSPAPAPC
jgi:Flp pilus assembly protein TadG